MKEWQISYTYLEVFQVPDDWDEDEVMKWAKSNPPVDPYDYNDIEIFKINQSDTKQKIYIL